jgi:hypothetical protein
MLGQLAVELLSFSSLSSKGVKTGVRGDPDQPTGKRAVMIAAEFAQLSERLSKADLDDLFDLVSAFEKPAGDDRHEPFVAVKDGFEGSTVARQNQIDKLFVSPFATYRHNGGIVFDAMVNKSLVLQSRLVTAHSYTANLIDRSKLKTYCRRCRLQVC